MSTLPRAVPVSSCPSDPLSLPILPSALGARDLLLFPPLTSLDSSSHLNIPALELWHLVLCHFERSWHLPSYHCKTRPTSFASAMSSPTFTTGLSLSLRCAPDPFTLMGTLAAVIHSNMLLFYFRGTQLFRCSPETSLSFRTVYLLTWQGRYAGTSPLPAPVSFFATLPAPTGSDLCSPQCLNLHPPPILDRTIQLTVS